MTPTGRTTGHFDWAGATLSVSVPDPAWLARLSDMLGLVSDPERAGPAEIEVHDATSLRSFETELQFATQNDLMVWLVLTIVDVLAEKAQAFLIHAASVCLGDGVALLSGPPYAGKSTMTLRARARGMRLLGDDVVLLSLQTLLASPVPRPVRERIAAMPSLGDPLAIGSPLPGRLDGESCCLHPRMSDATMVTAGALPVRAVYFLRRHSGPGVQFMTPSSFEATAMLLNHARAWGPKPLAALSRVSALLKQCEFAVVDVGDGESDAALTAIMARHQAVAAE